MTAHQNAGTPPDAQAVSLGCYAQLYRRVLRPGADGKRKGKGKPATAQPG